MPGNHSQTTTSKKLCTLWISWSPSSASSSHQVAPFCDAATFYIALVIPRKITYWKKGRSIGRIKSLTRPPCCRTNSTNYKHLQPVVCNHTVHKHPITMSSLFSSTLPSASMISNHLTVAYYSDTFHRVQTSQRCFASEKVWKFEMSAPKKCYSVFQMYSFYNMVCATEFYLLSCL